MKITFFLLTLFISSVFAEDVSDLQTKKIIQKLSTNATWLKLLHFKDSKSTVIDKSFFLADKGSISAKKELEATIEAYYKDFSTEETYAQCRFPARYGWLSKHIDLKGYVPINAKCTKLKKWKLLQDVDSLSVVFVSGYLGNPASIFGHSFIKVNQAKNKNDLFDTSISYGAMLPAKYGMPEYIFNGLTGGYDAAYTDKYYYNENVTYSNQEHRDMWEYRLALSDEKQKFFLFHAWELMGKKFQYFFLNRNCGYKVSEFLELLYDEKILGNEYTWYAPIETIYKLRDFGDKTISKVNYIPSKQQEIYAHYAGLTQKEKNLVEEVIEKNLKVIPLTNKLTKLEQANSLDFLLAYHKYLNPTSSNRALLLNRLKFPVRNKPIEKVKDKRDISRSNKLSYAGLSKTKESLEFHWSPFAIELEGYNGLDGDELVLFDTLLNVQNHHLHLKRFDLLRIQRLKTKKLPFEDENPFSWNLHLGTTSNQARDYFGEAGFGLAWDLNSEFKFYSMLNLSAHSADEHFRVKPNIGFFANYDKLRISSNLGYERAVNINAYEKVLEMKAQYRAFEDSSIFIEYDLNKEASFNVGIKWFY
jgi:hypothetical protein